MGDWIIRVGDAEFRARTVDDLREWRREGRIPDGAYIFHPVLQRWLYAREVEELKDVFVSRRSMPAPASSQSVLTRNISGARGCLILIAILLVLSVISSFVGSCNKSLERARSARAAEEEAVRRREEESRHQKEIQQKRTESLAALASTASMDANEIAQHCDQLGSLEGVPSGVLRKCAGLHIQYATAAVRSKDFSGANVWADRAQAEGATADELKSIRKAVAQHEDAERAKTEAARRREDARRKAAVASMVRKRDKLEDVTWYRDKTSPQYNNRNAFFLYFGEKGSHVWLRWRVRYYADDWLFIQSFTVYADGVPFEYTGVDFERDNDSDIWEWYDTSPTARDLDMIRAVIRSREAVVRFEGRQYRNDRTISAEQKRALQRVLDAFGAKGGSV